MLDFRSLETFLWVANLRSFRGAAERLHTTQPAVSMRIAQLEDDLGVKLLERDRRAVSLTEKGQLLLRHAERLIRQRSSLIEAVGDSSTMSGVVRLGVSETIVHTWLPRLIERVNATYPNLEIEIEVDISPNLRERLITKNSTSACCSARWAITSCRARSSAPIRSVSSQAQKSSFGKRRCRWKRSRSIP